MSGSRTKSIRKKFETIYRFNKDGRADPLYKKRWRKFKRPTFASKAIEGVSPRPYKNCYYSDMIQMKKHRFEMMLKRKQKMEAA